MALPEDSHLRTHHRENLKSYLLTNVFYMLYIKLFNLGPKLYLSDAAEREHTHTALPGHEVRPGWPNINTD
jgi:hypothetical protein